MVKRIIKTILLLALLLVVDQSCPSRNLDKMPLMTPERISSIYSTYHPKNIAPAFQDLRENANTYFATNAKEGGVVILQKCSAYINGFFQLKGDEKLVLLAPIGLVIFIITIITFKIILSRTKLKFRLEETTHKGTSF